MKIASKIEDDGAVVLERCTFIENGKEVTLTGFDQANQYFEDEIERVGQELRRAEMRHAELRRAFMPKSTVSDLSKLFDLDGDLQMLTPESRAALKAKQDEKYKTRPVFSGMTEQAYKEAKRVRAEKQRASADMAVELNRIANERRRNSKEALDSIINLSAELQKADKEDLGADYDLLSVSDDKHKEEIPASSLTDEQTWGLQADLSESEGADLSGLAATATSSVIGGIIGNMAKQAVTLVVNRAETQAG